MARRKNVKRIDPRYFLHETVNRNDDGSRNEDGPPLEEIFGLFKSKEEKAQNFFNQNIPKIESAIADAGFSGLEAMNILDRVEKHMIEYPTDANAKGIATAVRDSIRYHKSDQDRGRIADKEAGEKKRRSLKHDREEKAEKAAKAAREKKQADYVRDLRAREKREREDEIANIRGSYIPAAGSSTDRTRRRNRGELEEQEVDEGLVDKVKGFFGKGKGGSDDYNYPDTPAFIDKLQKGTSQSPKMQAAWDKDRDDYFQKAAENTWKNITSNGTEKLPEMPSHFLSKDNVHKNVLHRLDKMYWASPQGKSRSAHMDAQDRVADKKASGWYKRKKRDAEEKRRRQRERDSGEGLKNPEHMQIQKSNTAYVGSGGVGSSKRYNEE
jgi:hypothetical protein